MSFYVQLALLMLGSCAVTAVGLLVLRWLGYFNVEVEEPLPRLSAQHFEFQLTIPDGFVLVVDHLCSECPACGKWQGPARLIPADSPEAARYGAQVVPRGDLGTPRREPEGV